MIQSLEELEKEKENLQKRADELRKKRDELNKKSKELTEERDELSARIRELRVKIREHKMKRDELNQRVKSAKEKRAELKDRNNKIQKLKPLPKSVKNPDEFIQGFEEKQATLKEKQAELSDLKVQQAGLVAQSPEETQEEMLASIRVAESRYEQVKTEGEAIQEIRDAFMKVKTEKDSQTLNPWLEELGRVLEPLTADRYNSVNLSEVNLAKAVRVDGSEIPFDLLSVGTKVGLGLALRLSMAKYFLEGLEGFLVMDDPLVDMDPKRQEATAKVIQNFAREKQILIATCHPAHADLLGGHRILL